MTSSQRPIFLTAAALAFSLLFTPRALQATALEINSGPNIKTELLRSGAAIPVLSFTFALPDTATGAGLFEMFAGGDLNNITADLITVTVGATSGAFAFPVDPTNPARCDANPVPAGFGCPIPESVPNGSVFDAARGPAVGSVEGRIGVTSANFGTAGLVVPQSLLVGGTNLTFSLTSDPGIFDLYIDRLTLSYPSATAVPEPGSLALLALSLLAAFAFRNGARASSGRAQETNA